MCACLRVDILTTCPNLCTYCAGFCAFYSLGFAYDIRARHHMQILRNRIDPEPLCWLFKVSLWIQVVSEAYLLSGQSETVNFISGCNEGNFKWSTITTISLLKTKICLIVFA